MLVNFVEALKLQSAYGISLMRISAEATEHNIISLVSKAPIIILVQVILVEGGDSIRISQVQGVNALTHLSYKPLATSNSSLKTHKGSVSCPIKSLSQHSICLRMKLATHFLHDC